jgi:hypothetical protein
MDPAGKPSANVPTASQSPPPNTKGQANKRCSHAAGRALPAKATQGGATEATGTGGDRVWREALDPDEQRALKRFFE